jgi:hypothetical protein
MDGKGSFLDELTERLLAEFSENLEGVTIVFPNRRAGLFFTKSLASRISQPIWSPVIMSFEDFIYALSNTTPSDNLSLLLDLYEVFTRIAGFTESFDRFYYWGDMLLKDFDEIDKNLVPAKALFTTLKNLKEIDVQFNFLSNDEKKALEHFWGTALSGQSKHKDSFLRFWSSLYPVYTSFQEILKNSGKAYSGMIYRKLSEDVKARRFKWKKGKVVFAGFNALTSSEEVIIKWFLDSSVGMIFWDLDSYYFDNPNHEAGIFLRRYYNDQLFRRTFPGTCPSFIKNGQKKIHTIASSQYSGQPKIAGNIVQRLLAEQGKETMNNTVVVFPDESLVPQVLYSLPAGLGKMNITMGYQLSNSAFYSLFELLLNLQENVSIGKNNSWFYHRQVLDVLNHPFISWLSGQQSTSIINLIEDRNMIYINSGLLREDNFLSAVFDPEGSQNLYGYLINVLLLVRGLFDDSNEDQYFFEKEFSIVFYKLLNRLRQIFADKNINATPAILKKVLRYYSRSEKIPFSGEPLEGLQMMGLMETRNLDFENVIILSANEGQLPKSGSLNSFIPYNIRKAFGLPNSDSRDSIYSYLFYRLVQRSTNIFLIYNTEESSLRASEPSRFIYQLKFESGLDIQHHWLSLDVATTRVPPIVIWKDEFILERLKRYYQPDLKRYSPSALNMYLSCPLSFYYRYVLDIREEAEVSEDLDAAKFGNILHFAMQSVYKPFKGKVITQQIIDILQKRIDNAIRRSFSKYYGQDEDLEFQYEGKNILGREIIKNYMIKILEKDLEQTPFKILELERSYTYDLPMTINNRHIKVGLKGIIDRVDLKDDMVRIIDYKSGKDESTFKDITALFDPLDEKRNKAIFQTFFYGLLYLQNHPELLDRPIISGLYNLRELYNKDFDIRIKQKGKRTSGGCIDNILPFMDQYEQHLKALILEIYDPDIPFKHRDDIDKCIFCKGMGMPTDLDK